MAKKQKIWLIKFLNPKTLLIILLILGLLFPTLAHLEAVDK